MIWILYRHDGSAGLEQEKGLLALVCVCTQSEHFISQKTLMAFCLFKEALYLSTLHILITRLKKKAYDIKAQGTHPQILVSNTTPTDRNPSS